MSRVTSVRAACGLQTVFLVRFQVAGATVFGTRLHLTAPMACLSEPAAPFAKRGCGASIALAHVARGDAVAGAKRLGKAAEMRKPPTQRHLGHG